MPGRGNSEGRAVRLQVLAGLAKKAGSPQASCQAPISGVQVCVGCMWLYDDQSGIWALNLVPYGLYPEVVPLGFRAPRKEPLVGSRSI